MQQKNIPQHIGIIMDGNRRWAKSRRLPALKGHQKGYDKLKDVSRWCFERGVKVLSIFAFSTENWNRSAKEVAYLMCLLRGAISADLKEFNRRNVKLRISGRREKLPKDLKEAIKKAEKTTENNTDGILNICLNYGGRPEITDAVKKIVQQKIPVSKINEKLIGANLCTAGLPDSDLIIRTSGEQRLSGFLLWEGAYSELYFISKHWPDFSEKDLDEAIAEYSLRQRRFGK